jgi:pyruvate/2-oxoglutarate dehydrogenase complex dihydrolipoamide acyltransferase (E2) component
VSGRRGDDDVGLPRRHISRRHEGVSHRERLLPGGNLISKQCAHIGFTADMLDGPVAFLVGNATCKSLFDIACESSVLARKARDGRLALTEMQGRCITISRLGGTGRTGSLRSLMRLRTKEERMKSRLK